MSTSNYARYIAAPFNQPAFYPIGLTPDPALFRPLGAWIGRLILPIPADRELVQGAWLEVHHAPAAYAELVGQRVRLRWAETVDLNARFWGATRWVNFDQNARKAAASGTVLAERLDGLPNVNPFESLAGAHAHDDICVRLPDPVDVNLHPTDGGTPIVSVYREPVQISGRFYALVTFLGRADTPEHYRVRHYDRTSQSFSGPEQIVALPEVIADGTKIRNSTASGIEQSPCNASGWYIYGALNAQEQFVVQALAPRMLLRLEPQLYCDRTSECMDYLRPKAWKEAGNKGVATTALLCGDGVTPNAARRDWQVGNRGLVIHLFGGIGGPNAEPAAKTPLYWGHFAFGEVQVIHEPLADEPIFDIVYLQVYAHNTDGLTAGSMHYSRYSGDRQFGWLGARPIQDILIRLDCLTGDFQYGNRPISALERILKHLEVMMARYRIADGRGGTAVGALNNCAQDSAQALYTAITMIDRALRGPGGISAALVQSPHDAKRLDELQLVGQELRRVLAPWGSARADWEYSMELLGNNSAYGMVGKLRKAAGSWRTMLPPIAARSLCEVLFKYGASAWVLRTYQVGGHDPTIEPFVPNV
jgi:predicted Abi (CAAX) family protease